MSLMLWQQCCVLWDVMLCCWASSVFIFRVRQSVSQLPLLDTKDADAVILHSIRNNLRGDSASHSRRLKLNVMSFLDSTVIKWTYDGKNVRQIGFSLLKRGVHDMYIQGVLEIALLRLYSSSTETLPYLQRTTSRKWKWCNRWQKQELM
jgi:hypothetical protein